MIDVEGLLKEFATLTKGWDGYGGLPPTPEALDQAREFFDNLTVVPTNYGAVGIESHGKEFDFLLTISDQGVKEVYFMRQDVKTQ
jgi:hypothetical protein